MQILFTEIKTDNKINFLTLKLPPLTPKTSSEDIVDLTLQIEKEIHDFSLGNIVGLSFSDQDDFTWLKLELSNTHGNNLEKAMDDLAEKTKDYCLSKKATTSKKKSCGCA